MLVVEAGKLVAGLVSLPPMTVVYCDSHVLGTADTLGSSWGAHLVLACLKKIRVHAFTQLDWGLLVSPIRDRHLIPAWHQHTVATCV